LTEFVLVEHHRINTLGAQSDQPRFGATEKSSSNPSTAMLGVDGESV
jgi:hypothetical protein